MKTAPLIVSCALVLGGAGCVLQERAGYWPPPHPGLPPSQRPLPPPPVVVVQRSAPQPSRPARPHAEIVITTHERDVIRRYVKSCEEEERNEHRGHGKKKGWGGRGLPPGLAKKAERGRGDDNWDRVLVKGRIMPVEVYQQCHSLPSVVTVQLSAPPIGTVTVALDGRVVRLIKATREILDVFQVGG